MCMWFECVCVCVCARARVCDLSVYMWFEWVCMWFKRVCVVCVRMRMCVCVV